MTVVPPMPETALDTVDQLLTTTRAIRRRLDLDRPVDEAVIHRCIDVAVHAPSAEDQQNWRWLVVTDKALRAEIADYYRQAWMIHRAGPGGRVRRRGRAERDKRNIASVGWLAEHMHEVPALVIPCVLGRPPVSGAFGGRGDSNLDHLADVMFYGSVLPAVWSLQLALRARGLGSVMTCMHLPFEAPISALLGIPRSVTQVCLLPVAHVRGDSLRTAARTGALVGWNGWSDEL
jgi:nitroreductase